MAILRRHFSPGSRRWRSRRASWAIAVTWLLSVVGTADLLYAYYDGLFGVGLAPGVLGAAVYIPTMIVPPLLVTHVMAFRVLLSATSAGDAAR
jgi:hypothetical protein